MPAPKDQTTTIEVPSIDRRTIQLAIIGTRPLLSNRMSEKAKGELLLPGGRKSAADRAASLKHEPLAEFRASPYLLPEGQPALIGVMSSAFKGAMMTAALDLPGTFKSQIGRLVYVEHDYVGIYGVPQMFMSIVRSAGMNKTPDVRTRAIQPKWAALVDVTFVSPILTEKSVVNLLAAGGITAGVGDWRQEKGKGNYGQYRLTNVDDPEWAEVVASGGYVAQSAAMADPEFYDEETAELYAWWTGEVARRGRKASA